MPGLVRSEEHQRKHSRSASSSLKCSTSRVADAPHAETLAAAARGARLVLEGERAVMGRRLGVAVVHRRRVLPALHHDDLGAPRHAEDVVEAVARRHEALQQAVVRVVAVEEELPQLLRRQVLHLGSG